MFREPPQPEVIDVENDEEGMPLIPLTTEIEIKGVHFKICNPGVAECKNINCNKYRVLYHIRLSASS